jgi:hypothetical protein
VILQVALELSRRVSPITGAKPSWGALVEPDVVKTTAPKYDGNVMGPHVVLDGRGEGWLNLQCDFIKNGLVGHVAARRV